MDHLGEPFLCWVKQMPLVFPLNKERWKIKSPKKQICTMCCFCYLNLLILSYFSVSSCSRAQRVDGVRRPLADKPGIPLGVPVFGSCQCKANWMILFSFHGKKKRKKTFELHRHRKDIKLLPSFFLIFIRTRERLFIWEPSSNNLDTL